MTTSASGYARVRVRLTAHGVDVLNARDNELALVLSGSSMVRQELLARIAARKAGDIHETNLYTLMHEFGPGLVAGTMLPFDEVEIDTRATGPIIEGGRGFDREGGAE